ncbi:hypothetical protein Q7C36_007484 [Tachysurus vachellii]|uniref:Uncharacterized protein n=1 Tax=Tachysurus vachellii TaxID=175792 RepID=A0AA88SUT5_TACVA|nr:hypothetical protein Q7C36_007484 [Tachysurus vachellii]
MFACQLCGQQCTTPVAYVKHMRIQSNTPNLFLIKVLRALKLALERCGRAIVEFFSNKPTNADEGLILFANASSTAADVERTLELPAIPRLILLNQSTISILKCICYVIRTGLCD